MNFFSSWHEQTCRSTVCLAHLCARSENEQGPGSKRLQNGFVKRSTIKFAFAILSWLTLQGNTHCLAITTQERSFTTSGEVKLTRVSICVLALGRWSTHLSMFGMTAIGHSLHCDSTCANSVFAISSYRKTIRGTKTSTTEHVKQRTYSDMGVHGSGLHVA